MGLLDMLFGTKKKQTVETVEEKHELVDSSPTTPVREISTIIEILGNLGLLDSNKIAEVLSKKYNDFDHSILSRMMIKTNDENVSYLKKYFNSTPLGFGSIKTHVFKDHLYEMAKEAPNKGRNSLEIVEDMIAAARVEVAMYERILIALNNNVKYVEDSNPGMADRLVLIDFWLNYYKEQELGYPIDLDNKVKEMARELINLPYGGYGIDEVNKFLDSAKRMIEEARINGEATNHTLSRIVSSLFTPKKNRYLADVETLKRKLRMIDDSPYLAQYEKDQNKNQTITEFNQMNGHTLDLKGTIYQLKTNLASFEYGGFGPMIIDRFVEKAEDISVKGKMNNTPEKELIDVVKNEYEVLMREYQIRLDKMKNKLQQVIESNVSDALKFQRKEEILEDFHDEMGHEIDSNERINKMVMNLGDLDQGGYGEVVVDEFKEKSLALVKNTNTHAELIKALKEIRGNYNQLVTEYFEKLAQQKGRLNSIRNNSALTPAEKEVALVEAEKDFKFGLGYRMNFEKIITDFKEELKSLEMGGYGKKALDEFGENCQDIVSKDIDEKDKYAQVKKLFTQYRDKYLNNLHVFQDWKMLKLRGLSSKEVETIGPEIDVKITYMLSLSPKDLIAYYLEDEKTRKEEADKHNHMVACKYLARQEAKNKGNDTIYQIRLNEIDAGNNPYSEEEINKTLNDLQRFVITLDEDVDEDSRIISVVDLIDSTLLRQMLYVEAATANRRNAN